MNKPICLVKKKLPMRVQGKIKNLFKDLAEMQQGETEVWKAATSSTIYYASYVFSNNFAKFEGKTGIIKIHVCPFIRQTCMMILLIFNAMNSAMYMIKKNKNFSNLQQQTFYRACPYNQKSNTINSCTLYM